MITLYDLVFQEDRRPSPFCWRAKFALRHKGLDWRDEPMGFTEKHKIAFAESQTVPVIHDGPKVVKDSWAIAGHLDQAYPDKPLFKDATAISTLSETYYNYAAFLAAQQRTSEAREWAQRILAKKPTMPRYLRRRERPWFRKAAALLKRLPAH